MLNISFISKEIKQNCFSLNRRLAVGICF